jgi:hypothetical protein
MQVQHLAEAIAGYSTLLEAAEAGAGGVTLQDLWMIYWLPAAYGGD